MKTLTTLTAAAALIAGMSVASAQNTATPNQEAPPPSSINAGSNTPGSAKSGMESSAAAQSSTGNQKVVAPNTNAPPPDSINAGSNTPNSPQSGSQSAASANASGGDKSALNVKGDGQFCLKLPEGNTLDCQYASMAACQEIAKPDDKVCETRPNIGTVGAGMSSDTQNK